MRLAVWLNQSERNGRKERIASQMEKAVFDALMLRTVIGTINATVSPHSRKVRSVVVEKGLSAERDNRISESERRIVIEAIDTFESKLFNKTWNQLVEDLVL